MFKGIAYECKNSAKVDARVELHVDEFGNMQFTCEVHTMGDVYRWTGAPVCEWDTVKVIDGEDAPTWAVLGVKMECPHGCFKYVRGAMLACVWAVIDAQLERGELRPSDTLRAVFCREWGAC